MNNPIQNKNSDLIQTHREVIRSLQNQTSDEANHSKVKPVEDTLINNVMNVYEELISLSRSSIILLPQLDKEDSWHAQSAGRNNYNSILNNDKEFIQCLIQHGILNSTDVSNVDYVYRTVQLMSNFCAMVFSSEKFEFFLYEGIAHIDNPLELQARLVHDAFLIVKTIESALVSTLDSQRRVPHLARRFTGRFVTKFAPELTDNSQYSHFMKLYASDQSEVSFNIDNSFLPQLQ